MCDNVRPRPRVGKRVKLVKGGQMGEQLEARVNFEDVVFLPLAPHPLPVPQTKNQIAFGSTWTNPKRKTRVGIVIKRVTGLENVKSPGETNQDISLLTLSNLSTFVSIVPGRFFETLGAVFHYESEHERTVGETDFDSHDIDKCNSSAVGFKTALVEVTGCANSMPAPTPIASDVDVPPVSLVVNATTPVRTIDGSPSSTERQYSDSEESSGSEIITESGEPSTVVDLGVPLHTSVEASHSDGPDDADDIDDDVAIGYA